MLAFLTLAATATANPTLTVTGTCPGPVQVDVAALTPGATVALITGDAPGSDVIPSGPCAGVSTGLSGVRLLNVVEDTDGDGTHQESPSLPSGQCGRFLQVVDRIACQPSDVVQLVTGTCEVSGRMALIPGGWFEMGSPVGEVGRDGNERQHRVRLTHSYCLDETEVTQAEFESVMGYNPSDFAGCPGCPVETVSWHEAAHYANTVSAAEGLPLCYRCDGAECRPEGDPYGCGGYRLPTEAEWERAARGGIRGGSYPNGGGLYPGDEDNCAEPHSCAVQ